MKPILKWVGGKRQLMHEIVSRLPENYNNYYEPFLGGASVLLALNPDVSFVNDINPELINVYNTVKKNHEGLIKLLKKHKNESDYFYEIRSIDRDKKKYKQLTAIEKASRIIYLNKTCYNGLYRVNSRGELNAPFGKYKNPLICDEENIRAVSRFFNDSNINFFNEDFEKFLNRCEAGDFVYLDPPYDPVSDSSSFTGYNAGGFSRHDQERLKGICDELNNRGVYFLLSNSSTEFILNLYNEPDYTIDLVDAKRNINSNAENRGVVKEVLVRNY